MCATENTDTPTPEPTSYEELAERQQEVFAEELAALDGEERATHLLHSIHTMRQAATRAEQLTARSLGGMTEALSQILGPLTGEISVPELDKIDLEMNANMFDHVAKVCTKVAERLRADIADAPDAPPFETLDLS